MTYRFKFRRGSASEWAEDNPRLFAGEPGVELDTGFFKIGDGIRAWNDLSYYMDASGVEQALEVAIDQINAEGIAGDSAYEVAVKNGFVGTEEEWLESLKGEPGDPGTDSTVPGPPGDSAYEVAVSEGFSGTESEWLASLTGEDGADGVNGLYDIWQHTHGITNPSWGVVSCGAETPIDSEMLYFNVNSQRGQDFTGLFKLIDVGSTISCQSTLNVDSWIVYAVTGEITFNSGVAVIPVVAIGSGSVAATGWETVTVLFTKAAQPGPKGDDGASAYEVAVSEGFVGTESEWLDSLTPDTGEFATKDELTQLQQGAVTSFSFRPQVVRVVTGSETRPSGSNVVIWDGGTVRPANALLVDIWLPSNRIVGSNVSAVVGCTEAEYNALTPIDTVLYVITEE